MSIVQVSQLMKRYRSKDPWAVNGISFSIEPGQALGLLGPNGAGKTSTVKVITGLARPDAGKVEIFGLPPGDVAARRRIGYAPEDPDFPKFLTAPEVLAYFGSLLGLSSSNRAQRVSEALKWASLEGEKRQVRQFSKGMKQRLALAQAILGRPELLILDEPTADLDPLGRRDVRTLIESLKEQGTSVLLNSHLLSEVERVCDTVLILHKGQVVKEGPIHQVVEEGKTLEEVFVELIQGTEDARTPPSFISGGPEN